MYYVKKYSMDKEDEIIQSFTSFEDALSFECDLIKSGAYSENELCIEDFLR